MIIFRFLSVTYVLLHFVQLTMALVKDLKIVNRQLSPDGFTRSWVSHLILTAKKCAC